MTWEEVLSQKDREPEPIRLSQSCDPPPEPLRPLFDPILYCLAAVAVVYLFEVNRPLGIVAGLALIFSLSLHFSQIKEHHVQHTAWKVHHTEWHLQRARSWLQHFQKKQKDGAPWFDDDPAEWERVAAQGILNWSAEVQRLEDEFDKLLNGDRATADTTMTATNLPGAQVGYGHTATGNTATLTRIDYGTAAETLAEWRAYYEQHAEGRELAAKLAEAEALVRSGTPSQGERSRLRDVILDLSQILQGFPPAVQLFRSILGLVP